MSIAVKQMLPIKDFTIAVIAIIHTHTLMYRTYTYANVQYTMLLNYVSTPQNISHSVMTLRRLSMQEMVKPG